MATPVRPARSDAAAPGVEVLSPQVCDACFAGESGLHTDAPSVCSLKAALFTIHDCADERILVEHLLSQAAYHRL
jgi:hypothetical protein